MGGKKSLPKLLTFSRGPFPERSNKIRPHPALREGSRAEPTTTMLSPSPPSRLFPPQLQQGRHKPSSSDFTVPTSSSGRSVDKVGWEANGASASSTPSRPQQQSFSTPAAWESYVRASPSVSRATPRSEIAGDVARDSTSYAAPPSRYTSKIYLVVKCDLQSAGVDDCNVGELYSPECRC